jgi:hypothetical protein
MCHIGESNGTRWDGDRWVEGRDSVRCGRGTRPDGERRLAGGDSVHHGREYGSCKMSGGTGRPPKWGSWPFRRCSECKHWRSLRRHWHNCREDSPDGGWSRGDNPDGGEGVGEGGGGETGESNGTRPDGECVVERGPMEVRAWVKKALETLGSQMGQDRMESGRLKEVMVCVAGEDMDMDHPG